MLNNFASQRVTVMGLGTFGGGLGAVQFLADRGARVLVTDLRDETALADSLAQLSDLKGVTYRLGQHVAADFIETDLVVVNPAVPPGNEFVALARSNGVALTTEMSLFWQLNRGHVIAVTGSNGKSTTTALTHALLAASGRRCWLGGNIGKSLLQIVDQIAADDWVILELSSFQLEWLNEIHARPEIAIVTNFSANHLDWHRTIEHYRHAKQTLLRWQQASDWAVLNADDADVASWPTTGQRVTFGTSEDCASRVVGTQLNLRLSDDEIDLKGHLKLPGAHNRLNAAAAVAAALLAGVSRDDILSGLRAFQPLPHRLQLVAERAGRAFYNDSIATTPESAICGLQSFERPIVLLAGGYDKQVDLTDFGRAIAARVKAVSLLGQTADALAVAIESAATESRPRVHRAASLRDAFDWAVAQTDEGDIVLLSPGCASYDWFRNYIDRGEQFSQLAISVAERLSYLRESLRDSPSTRLLIEPHDEPGSRNMAIDECLLEAALNAGQATVRIYGWAAATVSLGYFQSAEEAAQSARFRGVATVRRLSGGGAILHHHEVTYSIALPSQHPLAHQPNELYRLAHAGILEVLARCGVAARMRGALIAESASSTDNPVRVVVETDRIVRPTKDAANASAAEPFLCFSRGDRNDIVLGGQKIVGSAQRRRRGAVLQHGSLLLRLSSFAAEIPGLLDLLPSCVLPDSLRADIGQAIAARLSLPVVLGELSSVEERRVRELESEKYSHLDWSRGNESERDRDAVRGRR